MKEKSPTRLSNSNVEPAELCSLRSNCSKAAALKRFRSSSKSSRVADTEKFKSKSEVSNLMYAEKLSTPKGDVATADKLSSAKSNKTENSDVNQGTIVKKKCGLASCCKCKSQKESKGELDNEELLRCWRMEIQKRTTGDRRKRLETGVNRCNCGCEKSVSDGKSGFKTFMMNGPQMKSCLANCRTRDTHRVDTCKSYREK